MRTFRHEVAVLVLLVLERGTARVLPEIGFPLTGRSLAQNTKASRQESNATVPAPIAASVSQYWEGNDGPWSSFAIQVGKRPQDVRLLPSTSSTSTWVVYEEGCPSDAPKDCAESRGRTFNKNNSQTWVGNSIFELGVDDNLLGRDLFGDFGFDTLTLGWQGSGGPTVEHSIIAGIADTHFSWLGVLGLNPRPTNFSNNPQSPQVSLVQALKDQSSIPSLSWAYTAGAPYRLNGVFGSLVLGGYDTSRFSKPVDTNSGLNFPFYEDISRDLLVGIFSVRTSNTTSSTSEVELLQEGIFAIIDSTVPYLWLPESACKAFESAFGLTWNSNDNLYTLSSSQHDTLSKLNPTIKFTLSPSLPPSSSEQAVSIEVPYSAFDLKLSWPYANSSTFYFPLKRASNDKQYFLGRAFLQEAYLIADYERENFSIWPCKWDANTTNAHLVPITSTEASSSVPTEAPNNAGSKGGLAKGAIAGIAVGAAVGGFAICLALWFFMRGKATKEDSSVELERAQTNASVGQPPSYQAHKENPSNEIDGTPRHELHEDHRVEAPGGDKFEMDASARPHEADSQEKKPEMIYEMDAQGDGSYFGSKIATTNIGEATPGSDAIVSSPVSTSGDSMLKPDRIETRESTSAGSEQVRSFTEFFKVFRGSKK